MALGGLASVIEISVLIGLHYHGMEEKWELACGAPRWGEQLCRRTQRRNRHMDTVGRSGAWLPMLDGYGGEAEEEWGSGLH